MEEKIEQLKDLLWVLDRRHNVSISKTQENINEMAERIVKLFAIHDVSESSSNIKAKVVNIDTNIGDIHL
jgi:hypothetical protein